MQKMKLLLATFFFGELSFPISISERGFLANAAPFFRGVGNTRKSQKYCIYHHFLAKNLFLH